MRFDPSLFIERLRMSGLLTWRRVLLSSGTLFFLTVKIAFSTWTRPACFKSCFLNKRLYCVKYVNNGCTCACSLCETERTTTCIDQHTLHEEKNKTLRRSTEMSSNDRITRFVCTNATSTLKLPKSVICNAINPWCFRKGPPTVPYFLKRSPGQIP